MSIKAEIVELLIRNEFYEQIDQMDQNTLNISNQLIIVSIRQYDDISRYIHITITYIHHKKSVYNLIFRLQI